jgi:hypothetical protein
MDTKNFLKEIRSIIREEIEYALEKKLKSTKPASESIKHGMSLYKEATQQVGLPKKTQSSVKQKQSNKNSSMVQSILNETRRSLEESVRYDDEFGGNEYSFTTDSLNAFARPSHGAIPQGVDPNELTPEVASALTRDYSALMAKINEKKGA